MFKINTALHGILILTLLLAGSITSLGIENSALAQSDKSYLVKTLFDREGRQIDVVAFPGKPPEIDVMAAAVPEPNIQMGVNILSDVPAFDWSYGCSATSAAMLFGYYDRNNYANMYTGSTEDGVCPLTNEVWGCTVYPGVTCWECPLSATHQGIDERISRGHVDDYWVDYDHYGDDPYYVYGWTEHDPLDCAADFMGTNQDYWGNSDGSTWFLFYTDGSPMEDSDLFLYELIWGYRDGCHGMRLFAESRGYDVITNFNQYIRGYADPVQGFTFDDFVDEIDAGRPVLIHVTSHTMIGYGYDTTGNTIYIHDTWNWSSHTMTWGGYYAGHQHVGVSVLHLSTINTPPTVSTDEATGITTNSARLNGYLNETGTATTVDVSFIWGDTQGGPYPNETTPPDTMDTTGALYFDLTSLSPDTTYYFKAKAVGDGTSYGVERSFTTEAEPDISPPYTSGHDPAKGATDVPVSTNIVVHVLDDGDGVDYDTIAMTVEGSPVSPEITGTSADYTLTYNPPTDFDYLQVVEVTVDATDVAGNPMTTGSYSFTTEESQLEYFYANQDIPVQNRGIMGSYLDTHISDDNHEGIKERESGGKPSKRHSYLEHKWTIPVIGGLQSYEFNIQAHHTANSEGDDFIFAYSTNDVTYTDMMIVTKTTDDNSYQAYALPQSISGSIYIRVIDTDQTSGNLGLDTIYIDHMYILGSGTPPPNRTPDKPSNPDPTDGATGVEITPTLSVYACDPDGDAMDISFYNESGTLIGTDADVVSGSRASSTWPGLTYETTYGWYAIADDGQYTNQSEKWFFTTRSETQPGGMYVWDISWASAGKNLKSDVTIRRDSDGDGIAESSDELVSGATVYYTLTHQPTDELKNYIETTDANGQISIQWKKATEGTYEGLVTDIIHSAYTYTPEMDVDNPDSYTF